MLYILLFILFIALLCFFPSAAKTIVYSSFSLIVVLYALDLFTTPILSDKYSYNEIGTVTFVDDNYVYVDLGNGDKSYSAEKGNYNYIHEGDSVTISIQKKGLLSSLSESLMNPNFDSTIKAEIIEHNVMFPKIWYRMITD